MLFKNTSISLVFDLTDASFLQKALCELRSNPDIYHLVGNYKDELLRYETLGNYTAGAVDSLPFALVNVTQVKCTLFK